MTRKEELLKAQQIFAQIEMSGTYTPAQIEEGFKLCYPDDKIEKSGFVMRKQFYGFMHYLHASALKELDNQLEELFEMSEEEATEIDNQLEVNFDQTITGKEDDDKSTQTHDENPKAKTKVKVTTKT